MLAWLSSDPFTSCPFPDSMQYSPIERCFDHWYPQTGLPAPSSMIDHSSSTFLSLSSLFPLLNGITWATCLDFIDATQASAVDEAEVVAGNSEKSDYVKASLSLTSTAGWESSYQSSRAVFDQMAVRIFFLVQFASGSRWCDSLRKDTHFPRGVFEFRR